MLRLVTSAASVVVGIGLGVGAMIASEQLHAQQQRRELEQQLLNQPEVRLVTFPAPRGRARLERIGSTETLVQPAPGLVFFKDLKSDGCWLASLGDRNEAVALAVAPVDACR
jgi:hypothetical protein